ncbi:MAG: hypothetical protein FJ106_09285 [Deltaproteobacteria bacterium]|nr:hypothetical protein [Deltaproteobacteria bacterium]
MKDKKRSFSGILGRMQGGIERLSGVVDASVVERFLGKDFIYGVGEGNRISFRRFKDDPSKGFLTFERVE